MPEISTLTGRSKFTYNGSCSDGFCLEYTHRPFVSCKVIERICDQFQGETIPGGFSMTNPVRDGLGAWLDENTRFSPRHGSHIAAVMVHEGLISYHKEGNQIMLEFPIVKSNS